MITAAYLTAVIAASAIPTVTNPQIIIAPCPGAPTADGCTYLTPTAPIYINPATGDPRFTLYHELGHRYWATILGTDGRHRFLTLTHHTTVTPQLLEEAADAYATCADRETPLPPPQTGNFEIDQNFPTGSGYNPTRREQRRVCALFASAGRRAGLHLKKLNR